MNALTCSCGASFEPCAETYRGEQDYGVELQALHNCPACHSTRAIVLWQALSEKPEEAQAAE